MTTMDPLDTFYQHLESEELLKRHGPELLADAREILATAPQARIGGLIMCADSQDAEPFRKAIAKASGQAVPAGLMVGVVPRAMVEPILTAHIGDDAWREESWKEQQVLPVVVSTRDGFRFGFFPLGERSIGAEKAE